VRFFFPERFGKRKDAAPAYTEGDGRIKSTDSNPENPIFHSIPKFEARTWSEGSTPFRLGQSGGGGGSDSEGLRDAIFMCVDGVFKIITPYLSVY
jgi:hypothetical protein